MTSSERAAVSVGRFATDRFHLAERYTQSEGTMYLTGLQALVRIPVEQHRLDIAAGLTTATLISGYEGSPLAGFDLEVGRRLPLLTEHGVVFRPGVNEELAVNAVQGSQLVPNLPSSRYDGVVGLWYGKAPGLDRATDALRHANLGGSSEHGGVLVVVGDDATAKSSTVPSSSEMAMAEIGLSVLAPCDPAEVLELGLHGIAMSRISGVWTGLKMATTVADGSQTITLRSPQISPVVPDRSVEGREFRHVVSGNLMQPQTGILEETLFGPRTEMVLRYARANELNRIEGDPEAKFGVVCAGATYLSVHHALASLGIDQDRLAGSGVRVLKLGLVAPLDPEVVTAFADGLEEIVVVEEKRAFVERGVKDVLYGRPDSPPVWGKYGPDGEPLLRSFSDLPPQIIAEALGPRITVCTGVQPIRTSTCGADLSTPPARHTLLPMAQRIPYFCSGCPHNRSTSNPPGTLVGGGIGCHTLITYMDPRRVGELASLCQMGGEGATWIGISPFVTDEHLVQNLGDGTYHHSGVLAVRASVAAGTNITYKLLHNGAVAMTGGQQPVGRLSLAALIDELRAEGVARIVVTTEDMRRYRCLRLPREVDVRPRDQLAAVQAELAKVPGTTVLIHDQECATELRRKRKRGLVESPAKRVFINERVCEGCGDCGAKSNCLSVEPVETEFGRKTRIHQGSCNRDYSCLEGDCPAFITVRASDGASHRMPPPVASADLADPPASVPREEFTLRITGIGGTGIVTTAQVVAVAAAYGGWQVRALDQYGVAQKGGAVVSDVVLTDRPRPRDNKLGPGECDLYLACDLLVACEETNLAVTNPARTRSVVSTTQAPTGRMVSDVDLTFPAVDPLVAAIRNRSTDTMLLDCRAVVQDLFGNDLVANTFILGIAVQSGALPIRPEHLEAALVENGTAVEENIQAFRHGRRFALASEVSNGRPRRPPDSDQQNPDGAATLQDSSDGSLERVVARRVADLGRYQNRALARRYAGHVEQMRCREERAIGGTEITEAFARGLYKLMAYKDEYEVARLSLEPSVEQQVAATFGADASYALLLHPPILRSLGLDHKIALGRWARPSLRALHSLRRLRGTALDPFGYTEVRRTERSLVGEYLSAVALASARLSVDNRKLVLELAELPDVVRGFEGLKLRNVAIMRERLADLSARIAGSTSVA